MATQPTPGTSAAAHSNTGDRFLPQSDQVNVSLVLEDAEAVRPRIP
ncbi:MAG: hypothetical protein ACXWYC_08160 [Actinomycetota bacterium]